MATDKRWQKQNCLLPVGMLFCCDVVVGHFVSSSSCFFFSWALSVSEDCTNGRKLNLATEKRSSGSLLFFFRLFFLLCHNSSDVFDALDDDGTLSWYHVCVWVC